MAGSGIGAMPWKKPAVSIRCGASNGERDGSRGKSSATGRRPEATATISCRAESPMTDSGVGVRYSITPPRSA
jgi:hypothetical protein